MSPFDVDVLYHLPRLSGYLAIPTQDYRACRRLVRKGLAEQRGPRTFTKSVAGIEATDGKSLKDLMRQYGSGRR